MLATHIRAAEPVALRDDPAHKSFLSTSLLFYFLLLSHSAGLARGTG